MTTCKAHGKPVCDLPMDTPISQVPEYHDQHYCHNVGCGYIGHAISARLADLVTPVPRKSPLDDVPELTKVYIEAGGTGPLVQLYVIGKMRKHSLWWYLVVGSSSSSVRWIDEKGIRDVE